MNSSENNTGLERIDLLVYLQNYLRILRKTWWTVPLVIALAAGFFGLRAYRSYSPVYRCQAVLTAEYTPVNTVSNVDISNSTYDSNMASRQVIGTFSSILSTDAMAEMLRQELGTNFINGTITPQGVEGSNIFFLSVTSSSPQDAYDILQAVLTVYPQLAARVIGNTTLELIREPELPAAPLYPRSYGRAAVKGGILGAAAILGLLFLLAQTRPLVHSTKDIQRISNLKCLGHVPNIAAKKRRSGGGASVTLLNEALPASCCEALRTIRTRLVQEMSSRTGKVILVTSSASGEGKSTLTLNLALSLAQSGRKVLLIDGDLRVQGIRELVCPDNESLGLGDLLQNPDLSPADALFSAGDPHLRILSGSTLISSPSSLLVAENIRAVVDKLKRRFDYIFIDTPPIGLLSDAASFLPVCSGVLYVVRRDMVRPNEVMQGLQALSVEENKLLGYVFTCSATASQLGSGSYGSYGTYSSYGYGYGYGYGYDYSSYDNRYDHYDDTASEQPTYAADMTVEVIEANAPTPKKRTTRRAAAPKKASTARKPAAGRSKKAAAAEPAVPQTEPPAQPAPENAPETAPESTAPGTT